MKTITIKNAPNLSKDHFDSPLELMIELQEVIVGTEITLTKEQEEEILRLSEEAEKDGFKGMSEEAFWKSIDQRHV